jgi:hypothetical protein
MLYRIIDGVTEHGRFCLSGIRILAAQEYYSDTKPHLNVHNYRFSCQLSLQGNLTEKYTRSSGKN